MITEKQQQAYANKSIKIQYKALSTAQYIRTNDTSDKVLKDADKIYQWLIRKSI